MSGTTETAVIIVGGGPAGLALAQGLRKRGVPFHVLERGRKGGHQGYRFRLMDYAVDVLPKLLPDDTYDLLEATRPPSHQGGDYWIVAQTGAALRRDESSFGHIYSMDRTWLHELLRKDIEDKISFEKVVDTYNLTSDGSRVIAHCSDGTNITGRLLVGADGNFSAVRRQFLPSYHLLDVGRALIWGRTPLTEDFLSRFGSTPLGSSLLKEDVIIAADAEDKGKTCLFAPMRWPMNGKLSEASPILTDKSDYLFFVFNGRLPADMSVMDSHEGRKAFAVESIATWSPELRFMFEMAEDTLSVPVVSGVANGTTWKTDMRVTFVGDAGHPSNGARGGTMAFMDACQLSETLGEAWNRTEVRFEGLAEKLHRYEVDMQKRGEEAMSGTMRVASHMWGGSYNWQDYPEWDYSKERGSRNKRTVPE